MKRVADSLFERVRKREEPCEIGGFDAVFFPERRVCDAVFDVFALGFFKFVNNVSPLSLCCVRFPNSVFKFVDNVHLAACVAFVSEVFFKNADNVHLAVCVASLFRNGFFKIADNVHPAVCVAFVSEVFSKSQITFASRFVLRSFSETVSSKTLITFTSRYAPCPFSQRQRKA